MTTITIHPVTPDRWKDFEQVMGKHGGCAGCWCMWWRVTAKEFSARKGEGLRRSIKAIIARSDVPPGLLAYDDGEPVGWCAVAPRADYPRMQKSRILAPIDDKPVWSISCFHIRPGHRRQGLTHELIKAAGEFVRAHGGRVLEAYPIDCGDETYPAMGAFTGFYRAFAKEGFKEVARRSEKRPIMRKAVRAK